MVSFNPPVACRATLPFCRTGHIVAAALLLVAVCGGASQADAAEKPKRPNVLVILSDDK